ncbi:MAG: gluconate 2-dehydrogenase subunit 3 family protein [Saprospiraceae bacterium]|nr:gluconate 2-dehydrogenase subunit 3 family protein [Lewinella sp.]
MNRREALSTVAMIMGGTVIGGQLFLNTGCKTDVPDFVGLLTDNGYEALADEVAETILPKTDLTPGAKDAEVGRFMNIVVTECYDEQEQQIFLAGLASLNELSRQLYQKDFIEASAEQRHDLLLKLEDEVTVVKAEQQPGDPPHYYRMLKQLSLLGFLTSEVGMTKAMRYAPVPGRFDSCIPYEEGEKYWA